MDDYSYLNEDQPVENPQKKKKPFVIVLVVIIIVLLLLLCCTGVVGGIYAITTLQGNPNPTTEAFSETATETEMESTPAESRAPETTPAPETGAFLQQPANQDGYADVVEYVMPCVVCINVNAIVSYSQFGQQTQSGEELAGSGSGVIVSDDDNNVYIVTNNHVVTAGDSSSSGAFFDYTSQVSSIQVVFDDGATVDAVVRGTDPAKDLAVIAVSKKDIPKDTMDIIKYASFSNDASLRLGQPVIAVGNAMGFGKSVTTGIISALGREVPFNDGYTRTLIQTDAAINPGNSGGGLFNTKGELIGVNSAKYTDTDVEGIGYAIPLDSITEVLADLIAYEKRTPLPEEEQGFLGVAGQDITAELSQYYGMPIGVYLTTIEPDSPAEKVGIRTKDIITKIGDATITSTSGMISEISTYATGEEVVVTLQRLEAGEYVEKQFTVTLGSRAKYLESLNQKED